MYTNYHCRYSISTLCKHDKVKFPMRNFSSFCCKSVSEVSLFGSIRDV